MANENKVWKEIILKFLGNKFLSSILLFSYSLLIFYLSSIQLTLPSTLTSIDPNRFFPHVAEYFFLGFFAANFFRRKDNSLLFSTSYSVFDEIHQYFVPGRFFDLIDLTADFAGSILGIYFFYFLLRG